MNRALLLVCLCGFLLACAGSNVQTKENKLRLADTNVRLGVGYLQQGRVDDALDKLQKALNAVPDYPEAHSTIALVYDRLGESDKAGEHFEQALKLKPEDGATHNNYAVFLCRQGKMPQAEQHFLKAINSRGYATPAQAWENLGVCTMRVPDLVKAESYLRKALQINERLPVALLNMARISYEKQRYLSGRAYLQRYQEVRNMGPDALWLGVQVENKLGNANAVQDYAARLRKHFPDSTEMQLLQESGLGNL